jgi:hypothetical protein
MSGFERRTSHSSQKRDEWGTRALVLAVFGMMCVGAMGQAVAPLTLQVDAAVGRHAISPEIYGIVSYDLDPSGGVGTGRRSTTGRSTPRMRGLTGTS